MLGSRHTELSGLNSKGDRHGHDRQCRGRDVTIKVKRKCGEKEQKAQIVTEASEKDSEEETFS